MPSNIDWGQKVTASEKVAQLLSEKKEAAKNCVVLIIGEIYQEQTSKYPPGETLSWSQQESAARAVLASNATLEQEALLDMRANSAGETRMDLALTIVTKANLFAALAMNLSGIRSVAQAAIEEATSISQVDEAISDMESAITSLLS